MPKYPVGYLRVESVRHESVRADSRKRLNSSSQLGTQKPDPSPAQSSMFSPTSQCAGTVARVVACRTGRRRRARSRTPGAWARLSRASAAAAAPPSTVVRARALRGGSAAGTRDRVGSTRCRLVESPEIGERAEPQRQLRNRPGGRPATGATSSTAPGAPARPARRHGVSDSVSDVSRDRGGLRRPSLAQERAESGPSSHDETARSRTAAERRRRY